ncbi:MAG: DNA-processing protein DprA [Patescibacteria group bacterium]
MSTPDTKYYNAFNLMPQIGPMRFRKLRAYFPSMQNAWESDRAGFKAAGIEEKIIERIIEGRKNIDPDTELEKLEKENIRIVAQNDENFPKDLLEISSPPAMLYVKGELLPDEFCLGIVGSRKISEYGRRVAEDFARELSTNGVTLVSGMAFGVDTITHWQCAKLKRRTIAVLGSGIDEKSIYPSSNRQIAKEIANCGCVISEYPIGTPPLKQNFPARNRIISGISKGVLVIEASQTSGSLITARFALEQNREVFAVPGNIYSKNSEGTNSLIKMGAKSACKIEDILEEFNFALNPAIREAKKIIPDSPEEELVLNGLSFDEAVHIDKLALATQIKTASLSSILTLMEIKGMIKDVGGMRYVKR